jgi:putative solute:sodium symporter small subunit
MAVSRARAVQAGRSDDRMSPESRLTVTTVAAATLLVAWALIATASLLLDTTLSPRFLDMPLAAFLAGQGALVGLVIVGVRVSRHGSGT